MKVNKKSLLWMFTALCLLAFNAPTNAQDDLYFDPSTDTKPVPTIQESSQESDNANTNNGGGDDQYYYEEEDDYAYEYSSRIRRFHEPTYAMDYYDPFFVDLYHYDPYYMPGASIYTYGYNDYWAYRRWQRWNAYNAWNPWNPYAGYGYGYGPRPGCSVSFGWGGGYRPYNPWYNPYIANNYYYDPYWTWNGHNPYYDNCAPSNSYFFYNNNNYYNGGGNNGYQPQTYTGPRRGGTTVGNGRNYARLTNGTGSNGRLTVIDNEAPVIAMTPRATTSREVVDKQRKMAEQQVDRAVPSTSRKPATTTAKDPAAVEGSGRSNPKTEKTRPTREALPGDNVPANRTPTETRPSRQPAQQTSPPRNEETRPSRPSAQDRPVRSSGSTETRPSRSSGNDGGSRTISPSSSGRSGGDSGSSGRSSGGNSGGSSKSSGGGGKSGRN